MFRHMNILVAEDNEADAFLLKRSLLKEGINAPLDFVETGNDAIYYLTGKQRSEDGSHFKMPNLIMLDLKMPGMDGFRGLGMDTKPQGPAA